jgi:hypothetical protein
MIRYNLHCDRGHAFESWFQSSSAYDSQLKRKLVSCPACGSVKVEKAIMAPQIARKKKDGAPAPQSEATTDVSTVPSTPLMMAQERELRAKLKELRDHVTKNADNSPPKHARCTTATSSIVRSMARPRRMRPAR